jgi:hypothetical protein
MGYPEFVRTFTETCERHLAEGHARAFAFVFYDVRHGTVRTALKQEGVSKR